VVVPHNCPKNMPISGSRQAGRKVEYLSDEERDLWRAFCREVLAAAKLSHATFSADAIELHVSSLVRDLQARVEPGGSSAPVRLRDGRRRDDPRWFVRLQSREKVPLPDAEDAVRALLVHDRTRSIAAEVRARFETAKPAPSWWRWLTLGRVMSAVDVVERRSAEGLRFVRPVSAVVPDQAAQEFALMIAAVLENDGVIARRRFPDATASIAKFLAEFSLRNAHRFADDLGRFLDRPQRDGSTNLEKIEQWARRAGEGEGAAVGVGTRFSHAIVDEVFATRKRSTTP
jgi:hypothetical protein